MPLDVRARRFFGVNAAVGACAGAAAFVAIGAAASAVRLGSTTRTSALTVLGQRFSHPYVNLAAGLTLTLAVIGLAIVILVARAALDEVSANRRFLRLLAAHDPEPRADFFVFEHETVHAFCAGLLRPQIYVSTGAVEALSRSQLEVVLAHERHHRRSHDPLRLAVGRVLARGLFFASVVGRTNRRHSTLAELAADEAAIASRRDGANLLASALLAFVAGPRPATAAGIAPERVDQLVGRRPEWRLPVAVLAGAGALSAVAAVGAWQIARLATVQATLNLPLVSAQPCIVMLALLPLMALAVALKGRRVQRA